MPRYLARKRENFSTSGNLCRHANYLACWACKQKARELRGKCAENDSGTHGKLGSRGSTAEQRHAITIKGLVLLHQIASVYAGISNARYSQQTEPLLGMLQSSASPGVMRKTLWIQRVAEFLRGVGRRSSDELSV